MPDCQHSHSRKRGRVATALPAAALCGVLLTGLAGAIGPSLARPGSAEARTTPVPQGEQAPAAASPTSVDDLRAIQRRARAAVARAVPATVALRIGATQGSGVIVRRGDEWFVLTAGHVSGSPGQRVVITLSDGQQLRGRTLGRDRGVDSGVIRITSTPPGDDEQPWPHAPIGASQGLAPGTWCLATGHPGGFQRGRPPVVRLGRVVQCDTRTIWTDCTIVAGDSGGPLFDLDGKVIAIHSRIGRGIAANYHAPIDAYTRQWQRLARGDEWGGWQDFVPPKPGSAYLGVGLAAHARGCRITRVVSNTTAHRAGLRQDDILIAIGESAITTPQSVVDALKTLDAGDTVTLKWLRPADEGRLVEQEQSVVLGSRPQ